MNIPERYKSELLTSEQRVGWLDFSLDFFTDTNIHQNPYLDITLQLDVTNAYRNYKNQKTDGSTFFSFLIWNVVQAQKDNLSFKLRKVDENWYVLNNAPIVVPVAVGGQRRIATMVLNDVVESDYLTFTSMYNNELEKVRAGIATVATQEEFQYAQFFGNLPTLQFTALSLHHRLEKITGQTVFYFGKRYEQGEKMFIPLSVKMHHACTDPVVLDLLLNDFQDRFF